MLMIVTLEAASRSVGSTPGFLFIRSLNMITESDPASCISALISKQSTDLQLPVPEALMCCKAVLKIRKEGFTVRFPANIGTLGWETKLYAQLPENKEC